MFNGQYTTGTITITSGSPNFTTSGAALQSADIRPGDVVIHNGLALVIASITGQNSGTFTANAPADAAGSGVPLRIIMQNDGSRLSARQAALIALLSGGNAEALAGLTGAANTGLHFTGPGQMATHDLTAFARSLLDDADAATMRATLDFGSLGIGATAPSISNANNAALGTFTHFLGAESEAVAANFPALGSSASRRWNLLTIGSSLRTTQIAQEIYGQQGSPKGRIFTRVNHDTWQPWREIVSAEYDSNANGEFIRYSNGIQEVFKSVTTSASDFVSTTWPASFANANYRVVGASTVNAFPADRIVKFTSKANSTVLVACTDSGSYTAAIVDVHAIGRWF